ncbi:MAG: YraN family protein [Oscillospiraceae bacterium]|nr:YraN family protein [Oscillospiraceae bacterium]
MDKAALGAKGEAVAARYYQRQGFELYTHNFRCREGELDLVMTRGDMLVIAEVKTRSDTRFALPREAVTPAKQRKIVLAAGALLAQLPEKDWQVRFDVVEVTPRKEGGFDVHCIPNAFEAEAAL